MYLSARATTLTGLPSFSPASLMGFVTTPVCSRESGIPEMPHCQTDVFLTGEIGAQPSGNARQGCDSELSSPA